MVYQCPNNCYITDKNILRCPRCGEQLLKRGKMTEEEAIEETKQRQMAYRKDISNFNKKI